MKKTEKINDLDLIGKAHAMKVGVTSRGLSQIIYGRLVDK